jgi:hypothetical protein
MAEPSPQKPGLSFRSQEQLRGQSRQLSYPGKTGDAMMVPPKKNLQSPDVDPCRLYKDLFAVRK